MVKKISILLVVVMLVTATMSVTSFAEVKRTSQHKPFDHTPSGTSYEDIFLELYSDINSSGYYSSEHIPYHSIETMIVEAPDYGHVTTSEAFSYYVWLEAIYGRISGNWAPFNKSWQVIEDYIVPSDTIQRSGMARYNPQSTTSFALEFDCPSEYPSRLDHDRPVGSDPIFNEINQAYSNPSVYLMHWLMDVDNWYEYGTGTNATFINTFQRGEEESTWETVPHPSIEEFKWGGPNGFLDLYVEDNQYSQQWRFTNAPDAEARAIQGVYWANKWAGEQGKKSDIATTVQKATKMGDQTRYNFFDKYYMTIGSGANGQPTPGNSYDSAHYLLSWYVAWGGGIGADWAWKIGCSHSHFGYQSPFLAWIMSTQSDFRGRATNSTRDWATSLERQLEFYTWLQSADGGIAGGATNSWRGRYENYPSGASTFHGMIYDENPVYKDPGSNTWFGMQVWSMHRIVDLYLESGNQMAKDLLDNWVPWVLREVEVRDGTFWVPSGIDWSGQPDTWTGRRSPNSNLRVEVKSKGQDLGVTGSLAANLITYAAGIQKNTGSLTPLAQDALDLGKTLLDHIWTLYRTDKGVMAPETRSDFRRFFEQEVYIPSGWTGRMGNGDEIKSGVKFIDIRSKYRQDPMFETIHSAWERGEAPEVAYHRYWAQCDVAIAFGTIAEFFPELTFTNVGVPPTTPPPTSGPGRLGDLNEDGLINSTDAVLLRRIILEIPVTGVNMANADINQDGVVNSTDYILLRRHILEISSIN
ncbi:UNVERIFIED_CONTAM: dockerin type I repeat protein [Acetivibrio alkalicellulosi]